MFLIRFPILTRLLCKGGSLPPLHPPRRAEPARPQSPAACNCFPPLRASKRSTYFIRERWVGCQRRLAARLRRAAGFHPYEQEKQIKKCPRHRLHGIRGESKQAAAVPPFFTQKQPRQTPASLHREIVSQGKTVCQPAAPTILSCINRTAASFGCSITGATRCGLGRLGDGVPSIPVLHRLQPMTGALC